ncbi:MAG: hypothetical protein M1608_06470, partial [Candidatus Omnitrophica bacterium]|nr:hypothetical protein [Candidatus Omnitrophota bacterium]
ELAMRCFVPVQQYLKRSGFDGLVVKWGDEVQIPALDMSGANPLFKDADIVRFVSMREVDDDGARNKDWVGVDEQGRVTAFIPRRPLAGMEELAGRGLMQRRGNSIFGGVNLGSIGVSYAFLDCLLDEFKREVNDPTANRKDRPALDPEFFTALTIAAMEDPAARTAAWERARHENQDVEALHRHFPDMVQRLVRAIGSFEQRRRRKLKLAAMNFEGQYWGDIGQHTKIYEFYMALNLPGPAGEIARAIAGLPSDRDASGNLCSNAELGLDVQARNSVLIDVALSGTGHIENSVLIGTRAKNIRAKDGFDALSTVVDLTIEPRGGTYKVVSLVPVHTNAGERLTTLFLPRSGASLFRVKEDTDLRNKNETYAVPILGNPMSFQQAHLEMGSLSVGQLEKARLEHERQVLTAMRSGVS